MKTKNYLLSIIFLIVLISINACSDKLSKQVQNSYLIKYDDLEKIDDKISHFLYVDDEGRVWYGNGQITKTGFYSDGLIRRKADLSFDNKFNTSDISKIGVIKYGHILAIHSGFLAIGYNDGFDDYMWDFGCKFNNADFVNCQTIIYNNLTGITSITYGNSSYFMGTGNGIYRMDIKDNRWNFERVYFDEMASSLNSVYDMYSNDGVIYASSVLNINNPISNIGYGILESSDNGNTWERTLVNDSIFYFAGSYEDKVYAYILHQNSFWTKRFNSKWELMSNLPVKKNRGNEQCDFHFTISKNGDIWGSCSLLTLEYRGGDFPSPEYFGAYLIKSQDNGRNWQIIDLDKQIKYVFDIKFLPSGYILLATDKGIFKKSMNN